MRQNYDRTAQNTYPTENKGSNVYQNQPAENKSPKNVPETSKNQRPIEHVKQEEQTQPSIKHWFISLGLFLGAFAVFAGVWAVQKFAMNHEIASHYYQKTYSWSLSMPAATHQVKIPANQKSIALELVLQWMMWKAPLILFTYNCIKLNQGILKWITLAVVTVLLLAADIVLSIFVHNIYNNMMYFGLFSLLTIIAAAANNSSLGRVKVGVFDSLFPLLCIAILYVFQNLALPILYKLYTNNMSAQAMVFLTFYGFPFIDLIMYAMLIFMGTLVSKQVRTFYERIHFLLIGYEVGFIMLVGYTQVEFYYLSAYLIFRNIFSNWVMWRWDDVVKLPPLLPGWILPYYFSYVLMFIPFGGIGNIVLSVGYYSLLLVNTKTVLYVLPSSLYPSNDYTPASTIADFQLNTGFKGKIIWTAAIMLWIATTFTQRYSKKMPQIVNSLIYNIFGIYLFYLGLSAGISTPSLTKYSIIS